MEKINASSDEINKVVKVIDDIAFQINLLALNANVEAARAGKYGKGFAVVADEVRNLAVKSTDSVKETTQMVQDTVNNIKQGTEAAEATAQQLTSIVDGSGKVADFLEEIAQASREQAQAIEQITEGLDQIDQATQASTASAEESASASEELAGQAQQLRSMVAEFKLDSRYAGDQRLLTQGSHLNNLSSDQSKNGGDGNRAQVKARADSGKTRGGEKRSSTGVEDNPQQETGITPVKAEDQISLEDQDFDRF
jgi:methyl-accepting chemotaxis protein